jgi:hypothetical protein
LRDPVQAERPSRGAFHRYPANQSDQSEIQGSRAKKGREIALDKTGSNQIKPDN